MWCPKQPIKSLRSLWRYYPDKWAQLRELEEIHGQPFKHGYPAWELEPRFIAEQEADKARQEMEKAQLSFFDAA